MVATNIYMLPAIMLSSFYVLMHLILPTILYFAPFIVWDTEVQNINFSKIT